MMIAEANCFITLTSVANIICHFSLSLLGPTQVFYPILIDESKLFYSIDTKC
jgi:hypothetical protein